MDDRTSEDGEQMFAGSDYDHGGGATKISASDRMRARFADDLSWRAGDEAPGDAPVSPYSVIDR